MSAEQAKQWADEKFLDYCDDLAGRIEQQEQERQRQESEEHMAAFNFGRRKQRLDDQKIIDKLRAKLWNARRDVWLRILAGTFFGFLVGLLAAAALSRWA